MTYRIRSRASRDATMINLLACICLACICMMGAEALIIARLAGH